MMLFSTGHSTTFAHCAREGCLYHAVPGRRFCVAHRTLESSEEKVSNGS